MSFLTQPQPWLKRETKVCCSCLGLSSMEVKNMRQVLENVPLQSLATEIRKLKIPKGAHVRVIIETLEEPPGETIRPDDAELRFLEEVENLPRADDLPKDLAHQHDHYLYGHPKKA